MNLFNKNYYEKGVELNISGYSNFKWMPRMTLSMCNTMVKYLDIAKDDKILDFGCAKGFIVKAFQRMDYNAFGVDISMYAILHCDPEVRDKLHLYRSLVELEVYLSTMKDFDLVISKDVMEHIPYEEIGDIVLTLSKHTKRLFCVVPLAEGESYVVPEYEEDITHIIREDINWWRSMFEENGFEIEKSTYRVHGMKDNWSHYPNGNGFFTLTSKNKK